MTKEQAIDQCRKIYELVKRGVDGEKESAKKRLEQIMQKHGIQMHDIEGEQMVWDSFVCLEEDRTFAIQIIASVLGRKFASYKERKRYYFKAPISKVTEIKDRWAHYIELYKKERDIFRSAFIQKHKIYAKPEPKDDDEDDTPLTPEEKARLYRMMQMMEGMEYSDYKKKLNHK